MFDTRISRSSDTEKMVLWTLIATISGAAALAYESIWLRRLSVVLGGSAIASAITLGVFMGGMGIGALLARFLPLRRVSSTYAALELSAAGWALLFPYLLWGSPRAVAAFIPLPAAIALGATWPVLAHHLPARSALQLYAANTAGAVLGVLFTTFFSLPTLGVRGAELCALSLGVFAAALAVRTGTWGAEIPAEGVRPPVGILAAAAVAGFVSLCLEVVWMRLASVGLGATVQTIGLVLAVFLATITAGTVVGRRYPRDPRTAAALGLAGMGVSAALSVLTWAWLPYAVALSYRVLGPEHLWLGHLVIAGLWMAGAPAASGLAFAGLTRLAAAETVSSAGGWLYGVNTVGSTVGAVLGGLVLLPMLEPRDTVILLAISSTIAAVWVSPRAWTLVALVGVMLGGVLLPQWDEKLYAVGVHLKISDFHDLDAGHIQAYANNNWDLLYYDHGLTAAVAVGRSQRTGNVWLSINGKFDASTGDDMPTQELSAQLPLAHSKNPRRVGVVGLASGVTAGAALEDPRVRSLDVFELEPAVVKASHFFDHVNHRPLDDPRTTLIIDDARAAFVSGAGPYDVIISEPSNPWITGVSNLFTHEYWTVARSRLADDGVFCQWVQLYGMGPNTFRGLIRTFEDVFGDVWLYSTIEGSDVLLIAGSPPQGVVPLSPVLDPAGVRRLGGIGWLNTDDHPRVEWEAPRWLHYDTATENAAAIERAAQR